MKKAYIIPALSIDMAEPVQMLAASIFDMQNDTQSITPTDEEYDGEFSTKSFGEFMWDE